MLPVLVEPTRCLLQIKEKIGEMEEVALSEKPWQLMGEVTGGARPENSLLQEHLEYDQTTRLGEQLN